MLSPRTVPAARWVHGALAVGVLALGCGRPVLRIADASLGDYYTEEEYQRLRDDQREEYCRALVEQDSIYRETIAQAGAAAAMDAARAAALRAEADSLGALADSLERIVAIARSPVPVVRGRPRGVTVREGESLWRISGRADIYGDPRLWPRLYEANRDRIRDADVIYPGQELRVPR